MWVRCYPFILLQALVKFWDSRAASCFLALPVGGRLGGFQHSVMQTGCFSLCGLSIAPWSFFPFSIDSSLLYEDEGQIKWWAARREDINLISGTYAIYIQDISGPTSCSMCVIFRRAIIRRRSGGWNCVNTLGDGDQDSWKSSDLVTTESGSQTIMACRLRELKESSECAACMARKGCFVRCLLAVFKSHPCLYCWQATCSFLDNIYMCVCVYIAAFILSPF